MNERTVPVADLVRRARAGDLDAWSALVTEFQDVAAGLAAGWSGDWTVAEDVAQDAFVSAFLHLDDLADPQAFPAWFKQVVHSATTRRLRGERRTSARPAADDPIAADPQDVVAARDEAQRLHRAVESLPEHERAVIALHYLARLPYPNVAELLGISVAAAKKRGLSARRRLKEQLPMAVDALSSARPSRDEQLRDRVALFLAIRRHDHDRLRALLARRPDLATATESWSKDEAMQVGLQHAEHGTPLVTRSRPATSNWSASSWRRARRPRRPAGARARRARCGSRCCRETSRSRSCCWRPAPIRTRPRSRARRR